MRSNKGYYYYLCEVAEEMNESFRELGSNDRAIVIRDEDSRYRIVILKENK